MIFIALFLLGYVAGGGTVALLWACCRAAARTLPAGGSDADTRAFVVAPVALRPETGRSATSRTGGGR